MIVRQGALRGDKVLYPDGIGCCVWYPLDPEDDSGGIAFDVNFDDIDDLITLLQTLKDAEPEIYEEEFS